MSRTSHRLSSIGAAVLFLGAVLSLFACGSSPTQPAATPVESNGVAAADAFKVATWNIRSGMGIAGFATKNWTSDTLNCTDRSQPLNAWGMGLPQEELGKIRDDLAIVAFAVQEAWN